MRRAAAVLAVVFLCASAIAADGIYNVMSFGAVGDGVANDTAAFQNALNAAAADRGGIVQVPAGQFRIAASLTIPSNVTLEGQWQGPSGRDPGAGTVLLAIAGAGNPAGTPFISMGSTAILKGVTIFYPNQTDTNPPVAYPWTIKSQNWADNCSLIDVTILNAWQAIDFGSVPTGRHYLDNVSIQAFREGLYINLCFDVGRVRNTHFGPIWSTGPAAAYMRQHGTAFSIGRTDGEQMFGCSAEGYAVGFRFYRAIDPSDNRDRVGSGVVTHARTVNCGISVLMEDAGDNAAWSIVNGSFEGPVENRNNQRGQFKFTSCTFTTNGVAPYHAKLVRRIGDQRTIFFESCTFGPLDGSGSAIALDADCHALIVTGCQFESVGDDIDVRLGPNASDVVIAYNRMRGTPNIVNTSILPNVRIGANAGYTGPRVGVTPGALVLTEASPAADLSVFNTGGGTLDWQAAADSPHVALDPVSGTGDGTIAVSANDFTQDRRVVVTVTNAVDPADSIEIPVDIVRTPAPSHLSVNVTELTLATGTPSAAFEIVNLGEAELHWTAASSDARVTVTPASGTGAAAVTVSTATFLGEAYEALVTVTNAANASNQAQIRVRVTPLSPSDLVVAPTALALSAEAPQASFEVLNTGERPLRWRVEYDAGRVAVAPASGTGDATVLVTGLDFSAETHVPVRVVNDDDPDDSETVDVRLVPAPPRFELTTTALVLSPGTPSAWVGVVMPAGRDSAWEVLWDDPAITVTPKAGVGAQEVRIAASPFTYQRTVDVVFTSIREPLTVRVVEVTLMAAAEASRVAVGADKLFLSQAQPSASFVVYNGGGGVLRWRLDDVPAILDATPSSGGDGTMMLVEALDFTRNQEVVLRLQNEDYPANMREVTVVVQGTAQVDINHDGHVLADDVQLCINALLGLPVPYNCDVDGDGRVTSADVQAVVWAALQRGME